MTDKSKLKLSSPHAQSTDNAPAIKAALFLSLIAAQTAIAIYLYIRFFWVLRFVLILFFLAAVALSCRVAVSKKPPDTQIAWIMFLLIFPPIAVTSYIFAGENGASPLKAARMRRIYRSTMFIPKAALPQELPAAVRQDLSFIQTSSHYSAVMGGQCMYYPSGESYFKALISALKNAQSFVFLEFFIVKSGSLWQEIADILIKKAKQGVDVRLLCDGFGSHAFLHSAEAKNLRQNGILVCAFEPVLPFMNMFLGYRDHRKIAVIDGRYAFTGGANIADEYVNLKERFGKFKDTGIRASGEAVNAFTLMFLRMWHFSAKKRPDYLGFLTQTKEHSQSAPKTLSASAVYADGPCQKSYLARGVYASVISSAQKYIYIMSPYFVVDSHLSDILRLKAQSGVDVRIVIPEIPDKKAVYLLTRYSCQMLLQSGVKVYLYSGGFVHGKVLLCDGERAVTGSINFDFRSFYQQYECGFYFTHKSAIKHVKQDFDDTFTKSTPMAQFGSKKPLFERLKLAVLRLFAPLM